MGEGKGVEYYEISSSPVHAPAPTPLGLEESWDFLHGKIYVMVTHHKLFIQNTK